MEGQSTYNGDFKQFGNVLGGRQAPIKPKNAMESETLPFEAHSSYQDNFLPKVGERERRTSVVMRSPTNLSLSHLCVAPMSIPTGCALQEGPPSPEIPAQQRQVRRHHDKPDLLRSEASAAEDRPGRSGGGRAGVHEADSSVRLKDDLLWRLRGNKR